jgi:DNA-directed RNA polymerase specialized sigma24 family protein
MNPHTKDLLDNKKLFPEVNDITKLTRTQDRILSELYTDLRKQLPKFNRWMKPIPSVDGEDLIHEALARLISKPWQLPQTKEEIEPLIQSYIMICKREFISNHHRRGKLSQDYASSQPKSTELELSPDMIVDTTSNLMQDALNKAILKGIMDERKVKHIADDLGIHRTTAHRRIARMRAVIAK